VSVGVLSIAYKRFIGFAPPSPCGSTAWSPSAPCRRRPAKSREYRTLDAPHERKSASSVTTTSALSK
jgi:hypothetical protein